jgi:hypothetical protein
MFTRDNSVRRRLISICSALTAGAEELFNPPLLAAASILSPILPGYGRRCSGARSCCKDQARIFNLIDFAKTGDFSKLPVVRAGDTIYIPNMSRSDWTVFMNGVRDTVSLLSIFALLQGGLF